MLIDRAKFLVKRILKPSRARPVLSGNISGGPENAEHTFVMVVRQGFNSAKSNANSTIRLAYCRAFARLGIRYRLVSSFDLGDVLTEVRNPFVFLSAYDYFDFGAATRRCLRSYPHFVWVNPDADMLQKEYTPYGAVAPIIPDVIYKIVADSHPRFVWAPVPPSALRAYSRWAQAGIPLRSLPQACDTERYFPVHGAIEHSEVKMAFVGGYWPNKAIHFDQYLRPYEDLLTVFGYSKWPYKNYRGLLPDDQEKILYQNAILCPAISEPHAVTTGDIVERVYKVLGSGGLAITDCIPFYRELFRADELLVPRNINEYHSMVRQALGDSSFRQQYRRNGLSAVLERHTYIHRARSIADWLQIPLGLGDTSVAAVMERLPKAMDANSDPIR
jgi:hypothetical protein